MSPIAAALVMVEDLPRGALPSRCRVIRRRPSVNHTRRASSQGRCGAVTWNASFPVTLVVQKYGGTSVADLDRIRNVAARVKRQVVAGRPAGGGRFRHGGLHQSARGLGAWPGCRRLRHGRVRSGGRQRRAGHRRAAGDSTADHRRAGTVVPGLAGGLRHRRAPTARPGSSRSIPTPVRACLAAGKVAVVAGFQGMSPERRVTTLGRGGSDTSAVALAAALGADRCDIFTDVDGVYTTDPAHRGQGAQARSHHLRGDAGDGLARGQGAADALGGAGDAASRPGAGAVELRGPAGHARGR